MSNHNDRLLALRLQFSILSRRNHRCDDKMMNQICENINHLNISDDNKTTLTAIAIRAVPGYGQKFKRREEFCHMMLDILEKLY